MAGAVTHNKCGMSTMTMSSSTAQVVSNAVTGESTVVERSVPMVLFRQYYELLYNDDGWAYLKGLGEDGDDCKLYISSMTFKKTAIQSKRGRVAIQTDGASVWLDIQMQESTSHTFTLSDKEKLSFVAFNLERCIDETRCLHPHQCAGHKCWEFRCIKVSLKLDVGDAHNEIWSKKNFQSCTQKWAELYNSSGQGVSVSGHFIPSHESWLASEMKAAVHMSAPVELQSL